VRSLDVGADDPLTRDRSSISDERRATRHSPDTLIADWTAGSRRTGVVRHQ